MNKLNLPPFYIGQKVKYIHPDRLLNPDKIYTIKQIHKQDCGCYAIDVDDVKHEFLDGRVGKCGLCKKIRNTAHIIPKLSNLVQYLWFTHLDFKPVQESPHPSLTFTQIKEVEKEEILLPN